MNGSPAAHVAGVEMFVEAIRCERPVTTCNITPEREPGNKFNTPDFETPLVTTRRPRHSENLHKPLKTVTNDPSGSSPSVPPDPDPMTTDRFCTPRLTFLKPRGSRRDQIPLRPLPGADGHAGSRPDGVPTAHVTPSLSRTEHRKKQTNVRENTRTRQLSAQSRRWHSSGNLPQAGEEFRELRHDPDPTLDTSGFYREAEDVDLFRDLPGDLYGRDVGRDLGSEVRDGEDYFTTPRPASMEPARRPSQGHTQNHTQGSMSTSGVVTTIGANNTGLSYKTDISAGQETDMFGMVGYRDALYGNRRDGYHRAPTSTLPPGHNHPAPHHATMPHPGLPHPSQGHHGQTLHAQGSRYYPGLPSYPQGIPPVYPEYQDPHFSTDLTHWQRQHQDQLIRQQYEAAQPTAPPAPLASYTTPHSVSKMLLSDPHKLDAVKKAADNIIKEKDNIIDKQKLKILELERMSKQSEVERHREMLQTAKDEEHHRSLQIQDVYNQMYFPKELQYENASLKANLAEINTGKKHSGDDLEKKLGATEFEFQQFKISAEKQLLTKSTELRQAQEKLSEREQTMSEMKDRHGDLQKAHDSLKKQVDSMNRYFEDLPTAEEHSKKAAEIKTLKEERSRYKHRSLEFEKRLNEAQKSVTSRESLIETLEGVERDLKTRISELERENARLRDRMSDNGMGRFDEDMEELKYENKKLKSDISKAKKLLDSKHKKLQSMESRHKDDVTGYAEKMAEGQTLISKLREELQSKEQTVKKLRESIKELGAQNQSLMDKSHLLSDRVGELERLHMGEAAKLERRLMAEIGVAVSELQALVQICVQRAEGQDVNMSLLLGVKCSPLGEDETESLDNVTSLKQKVTKVREMRSELEELRNLISTKYAEDMGENLNCATQ